MENQEKIQDSTEKYEFKMDKIEKRLNIVILIIFFMSFQDLQNKLFNILLFGFTIIILGYYFIWYRKKPAYVVIEENEIVINKLPFFKPNILNIDNIKKVNSYDKGIQLEYEGKDEGKRVIIHTLMLDHKDTEKLVKRLKAMV